MKLLKGQDELNLTDGSIAKPLFYLSLPIIVTNLLQVAYNLADTFWLGQFDEPEPLAAITFGFPLVFLLISLGMGLSVAGSVLVAQHTGADEKREAEYAASQTVTFAFIASTLLGLGGYFVVADFMALLGAEGEVLTLATEYMEVIALGLPFMFGFFVFISLMRGSGDTITPMLVMFGTVVLNITLDPFLIFGWGPFPALGVQGAAVATVFSRGLAMLVGMGIMLAGTRGIRIRLTEMAPDLTYIRKLLRIGIPASIEGTGRALSVNFLLVIVATFSVTIEAAFGVGIRVFSLVFMPAIAVDRGVETMTGQNIGADKPERAAATNHFAARVSFLVLAAFGVVIFVTAPAIMNVFTDQPDVVAEGATFLRWVAPTFGFIGIVRAYSGGFRGAGKTLTAAAISITMLAVIRLPVAFVASQGFAPPGWWILSSPDPRGIWLAFAVSNVLAAGIAFLWFERGTWREADLTEDEGDSEAGGTPTPTDD
ncbi:MATE family efflux transporter [Halorientalis litorea]|jgi:putative MATE family efflux protein|uniref:MATE family efflux transporter n=1 Tax=Halorientalis litorea TaxID=2931977 RepID=UPI001FF5CD14|nr:MATE family efflux transporter [Halorientalis litorea]